MKRDHLLYLVFLPFGCAIISSASVPISDPLFRSINNDTVMSSYINIWAHLWSLPQGKSKSGSAGSKGGTDVKVSGDVFKVFGEVQAVLLYHRSGHRLHLQLYQHYFFILYLSFWWVKMPPDFKYQSLLLLERLHISPCVDWLISSGFFVPYSFPFEIFVMFSFTWKEVFCLLDIVFCISFPVVFIYD